MDFIRAFETDGRPQILALLEQYADWEIHVFRSREQAEEYLQNRR